LYQANNKSHATAVCLVVSRDCCYGGPQLQWPTSPKKVPSTYMRVSHFKPNMDLFLGGRLICRGNSDLYKRHITVKYGKTDAHPSNEYGLTRGSSFCDTESTLSGSIRTSSTSSNQISLQQQHINGTLSILWNFYKIHTNYICAVRKC